MSDGPGAMHEMKDESGSGLNTPGFEPATQWSEFECSTARTNTPCDTSSV